jgi:hypothetical protein
MGGDLICYQFSRSKAERGDFRHFLGQYTPDKLPTGRRLRDMLNGFVFALEGWDNDPREIHTIPEIRRSMTRGRIGCIFATSNWIRSGR